MKRHTNAAAAPSFLLKRLSKDGLQRQLHVKLVAAATTTIIDMKERRAEFIRDGPDGPARGRWRGCGAGPRF